MSDNRISRIFITTLAPLFLIILSSVSACYEGNKVEGFGKEEAMKLGELMYREGILPSGEPMLALVQGDIPVDSRMFSCASCHLRSGLGSLEGRVVTYPIDGITLYRPLTKAWNARWVYGLKYARSITGELRSAYNDESLAAAIRGGVNPDGKVLNFVMPRYPLSEKDMAIMIFYLKNLSARPSPGVTNNTIKFATIIAGDVGKHALEEVIRPLKLMAGASLTGRSSKMAQRSIAFDPEDPMNKGYVKVSVTTWTLEGPRDTWRSQLDEYYRKEPVFAIAGGLSSEDWEPIHDFCEIKRMPCILPVTDLPVVSDDNWYTVYFSKGFYQEGEAVAKYLNGITEKLTDIPVLQIIRDSRQATALARGFEETWAHFTDHKPLNIVIKPDQRIGDEFWRRLVATHKGAIVLLWLEPKDLSNISILTDSPDRPKMIFLSSTFLRSDMFNLPPNVRSYAYITYPYRLPDDFKYYQQAAPGSKVNTSFFEYPIIQEKTNFNVMLISKSIFMLKGYFVRDRFLEVIDMMKDEVMMPLYPRVSFGPGQRYLSKGCYIVKPAEGPDANVIAVSDWVIP